MALRDGGKRTEAGGRAAIGGARCTLLVTPTAIQGAAGGEARARRTAHRPGRGEPGFLATHVLPPAAVYTTGDPAARRLVRALSETVGGSLVPYDRAGLADDERAALLVRARY